MENMQSEALQNRQYKLPHAVHAVQQQPTHVVQVQVLRGADLRHAQCRESGRCSPQVPPAVVQHLGEERGILQRHVAALHGVNSQGH